MGIKQLYNDNLRKLPNEYGDVFVMSKKGHGKVFVKRALLPVRGITCSSYV